ncbi:hypothetical protein TWF718_010879 [Orbilia javanica]|uniref:F-box domain-containing protein n=1 Tax=Orbilia javanica TaxID=47235 RepID=A0AAN8MKE2_9PEZI
MDLDIKDSSEGLLSALPTEIWYHVLSFLDPEEKEIFARCSWICFFIAFPNGVKIPDVYYEWSLRPFADGGRLKEYRGKIRSARFEITNVNNLYPFLHKVDIFPNLRRIEINFITTDNHVNEIFHAMISLLSTLPCYENLTHLVLVWHNIYDRIGHLELEKEFIESWFRIPQWNQRPDNIHFPQSLRSLTLFTSRTDFLTPLLSFEKIIDLVLLHPLSRQANLDSLPRTFPCVETFSFPRTRPGAPGEEWIQYIPKFPKLKKISIAWPQIDGKNAEINVLEAAIETRLSTSNDFPKLETVVFSGCRYFANFKRNIIATCVISRTRASGTALALQLQFGYAGGGGRVGEVSRLSFAWHGNLSNYQDDPSFLDNLLDDSSGDEWEKGKTDQEDSETDGDEDCSDAESEEEDGYDSEYFEYLSSDDELYIKGAHFTDGDP